MISEFKSYVQDTHERVFFAPDFGEPGGVATVTRPDGTSFDVVIDAGEALTDDVREWPGGVEAPGMPVNIGRLDQVGDYTVHIRQVAADGTPQLTTYLIHSQHDATRLATDGS